MQVRKWYLFLIRMVSPQTVGLILFCLIGVPAVALDSMPKETGGLNHNDYLISGNFELGGTFNPSIPDPNNEDRNDTNVPVAKERTTIKLSFTTPSLSGKDRQHGHRIIPNLFQRLYKISERKRKHLSDHTYSYPKERASDLPKLVSRLSESSDNTIEHLKITNHRPYQRPYDSFPKGNHLLDAESRPILRNLLETLFPFGIADISYDTSSDITLNEILKQLEQLHPKEKTTNQTINDDLGLTSNDSHNNNQREPKSESKSIILIANINKNAQRINFDDLQDFRTQNKTKSLDALRSSEQSGSLNNLTETSIRKGRHFELSGSKSREGREVNPPPLFLARIRINDAVQNTSEITTDKPKELFNYTYQLSALKRESVFPHDPFQSAGEEEFSTSMTPREEITLSPLPTNDSQNLTIYEILKPRLRTTMPPIFDRTVTEYYNHTTVLYGTEIISEENLSTTTTNASELDTETTPIIPFIVTDTLLTLNEHNVTILKDNVTPVPISSNNLLNSNYSLNNYNWTTFNISSFLHDSDENNTKLNISREDFNEFFSRFFWNITDNILAPGSDKDLVKKNFFPNHPDNTEDRSDDDDNYTFYDKNLVFPEVHNSTLQMEEGLHAEGSEAVTQMYDRDLIRQPKMTDNLNSNNTPFKRPKLDPKVFYDYFAKLSSNMSTHDFPYPEYRPGNLFRYSDLFQRKPILDIVYTPPTPVYEIFTTKKETYPTDEPEITPTTFDSMRTSVRVSSTFYPNRMQDITMKFGNRGETPTTLPTIVRDRKLENRNDEDHEDLEYRDIDTGFTMEKLAYLLIGTCCGLSILCLCVVVAAIKCRRVIVEKRLKSQFRRRMYQHERMKDGATPWQQEMFNHFMYLHRHPDSSSSSADSCNCRCVTWSLGPRNLDANRTLCPTNRSSLYLCGQKKLPFGAASTLRYESMLGRKGNSPAPQPLKSESPNTDSSHENDSLDQDSDSREGDAHRQCTCIEYNMWPMPPTDVRRGFFGVCPGVRRCGPGECSRGPFELRSVARDVPPPVTGSNYLDRSEGVVYWSSNEERLI